MPSRDRSSTHSQPDITGSACLPLPAAKPLGAPTDKSLFRRIIPCSGNENSLFGSAREFVRKPFKLQRDLALANVEMARNW